MVEASLCIILVHAWTVWVWEWVKRGELSIRRHAPPIDIHHLSLRHRWNQTGTRPDNSPGVWHHGQTLEEWAKNGQLSLPNRYNVERVWLLTSA